jgi:hypothetical protein
MKERLWWALACLAIQVGWISPHPAAAQQPMAAQGPVAGQEPLFPQAPLATQTQEPVPAPQKLGGQFFFSAGGSYFPGATPYGNKGQAGFSLGFGADLPIVRDPLFGNTWLGELAFNFGQFSGSNDNYYNFTSNELAIIGAPKYRIELGRLRPWIIPVGMEFLVGYYGVNVGIPFGAGIDYMLTPTVSVGLDWRYNLNLSPSSINFGSFMTYGAYVGFNFW